MKTSQAGIDLIKEFEGLRLKAYPDPATGGAPWTIGYGTTSAAGVGAVYKGMEITQVQAESMLVRSLEIYEKAVLRALTRIPTQPQFDAMVSLAYNIGSTAFASSSVVRNFNAGNIVQAAGSFRLWTKAGGKVMPGLIRRRDAERALFLKGTAVGPAGGAQAPAAPSAPVAPAGQTSPPSAPQKPDMGIPMSPPETASSGPAIAKWLIAGLGLAFAALGAWITKG